MSKLKMGGSKLTGEQGMQYLLSKKIIGMHMFCFLKFTTREICNCKRADDVGQTSRRFVTIYLIITEILTIFVANVKPVEDRRGVVPLAEESHCPACQAASAAYLC